MSTALGSITNQYGRKSIGIIGGVGPQAGMDLMFKLLVQTKINLEQDHLPVTLLSYANRMSDRTEYLLGRTDKNPADALFKVVEDMEKIGVSVAAVACNTAHVSKIFGKVKSALLKSGSNLQLLNIAEVTIEYIKEKHPELKKIGILSTNGTYTFKLYENYLEQAGISAISMPADLQESLVHACIYDGQYGIKYTSPEISLRAKDGLNLAAETLIEAGAEAIIMGCTEIPLALRDKRIGHSVLIDPNWVLARALILAFDPSKLKCS